MTNFQFQSICVQNLITPSLVWELQEFKDLVINDNLTNSSLQEVIDNNF
jgi:hypothetical protein